MAKLSRSLASSLALALSLLLLNGSHSLFIENGKNLEKNSDVRSDRSLSFPESLPNKPQPFAKRFGTSDDAAGVDVNSHTGDAANAYYADDVNVDNNSNFQAQDGLNPDDLETLVNELQYGKGGFADEKKRDAAEVAEIIEAISQRLSSRAIGQRRAKRTAYLQALFQALYNAINNDQDLGRKARRTAALNVFINTLNEDGATSKGGHFTKQGVYNTAVNDFYGFEPTDVHCFSNPHNGIQGCRGQVGNVGLTVRDGSSSSSTFSSRPTMEVRAKPAVHKIRYDAPSG